MDNTIELYQGIVSKKTDGTVIKTWGYKQSPETKANETIIADVQPQGLSEAQLKQWGISTLSQDAKVVYFRGFSSYLMVGNRARVDGETTYDVKSINLWPSHTEAILVPVMGE